MSVGANIKKRRYELRMSQQELADAMGYRTRSTIAKIESGENDVSQKKLLRFAAVLDTTPEALVAGYGQLPSAAPEEKAKGPRTVAIILAGGKTGSNRQNIPSQFISVHGKPILVYCMEAYQSYPAVDDIYAVCLKGWESIVKAYADRYGITKLRGIVTGGASGMLSLKNALDRLDGDPEDTILIQEATRPMVAAGTISRLLQACAQQGSATICHSMREYVQFDISRDKPGYVDRNSLIAVQSPEAHRLSLLRAVFDRAKVLQHPLTESCCTMLLHHLGYPLYFVESSVNNIKLAREEDLAAFSTMAKAPL